jgi:hypothetical protein
MTVLSNSVADDDTRTSFQSSLLPTPASPQARTAQQGPRASESVANVKSMTAYLIPSR